MRVEFFVIIIAAVAVISAVLTLFFFFILNSKFNKLMSNFENFSELLVAIDAATTKIGENIEKIVEEFKRLRDELTKGGMTPDEEKAIFDRLTELTDVLSSNAERLKGIAQDEENPVPPDPDEPEEPIEE